MCTDSLSLCLLIGVIIDSIGLSANPCAPNIPVLYAVILYWSEVFSGAHYAQGWSIIMLKDSLFMCRNILFHAGQ